MSKYVFHIDVNSAFLAWTAAYRVDVLGEKEDIRLIPSIVGGDQEKRHGIVLAKSTPAKKYGIKTGEPIVAAQRKCPGLVIVPPDYGLYVKSSRAFMDILKDYSDNVIQYSIDEAWVVFEGFEKLYGRGQMVNLAYELRDRIRDELGFTVNVGISTNFLLSKMAGDFSKPNKVHTLFPEEIEQKMWQLPVSDLFLAGRATVEKLNKVGIQTIGELAQADEGMIRSLLKKHGQTIQGFARGGDLDPGMISHEANKGYGNSMTAPIDVVTEEYAKHLLLSLSETVGTRLRADGVMISVVSVHLTTCEFQRMNKQMQLDSPTNITEEIYGAACQVFGKLWDKKTPIRQLGVHTSKVQENAGRQYSIFDLGKSDKLEKLDKAVDKVREKYGEDAIFRASFLKGNVSHMSGGLNKERRSGVTLGIDVEGENVRDL
ncbi:MAG: DNA polymerase IV [Lachnospiraceae bacterium]|nr:DNA polymerase IV [Lachnospiraceae bacterium]RKI85633.1 DNA polymerase IV [bacterium 1xD42-87]